MEPLGDDTPAKGEKQVSSGGSFSCYVALAVWSLWRKINKKYALLHIENLFLLEDDTRELSYLRCYQR